MKIDNLNNEKKEKKNQSYPVSPVFVVVVVEKFGKWMNFEFGKKNVIVNRNVLNNAIDTNTASDVNRLPTNT